MANIHPTAIVDRQAEIASSVKIGPYSVIGPHVSLAQDVELLSHVVVEGRTTIGAGSRIFPFAVIGHRPQDLKYKGEPSTLTIGKNTVIREHVTMHPGTAGGAMRTVIGDNCLFMAATHVAHDCTIANDVILANNATLGGHVTIGEHAILGGLSAVHQFVRIGAFAMIGGMTGVEQDVIPYGLVMGERGRLAGLNLVGLMRGGFSREEIHTLRTAYRLLFAQEGTLAERVSDVAGLYSVNKAVMDIISFVRSDSSRPICQPRTGNAA
jgi:UDP-N-acetylglucosamine acyltransferase